MSWLSPPGVHLMSVSFRAQFCRPFEMLTLPVSDLGECHRREVSGALLPVLRQVATAIRYAPAYRCGSPSDRTADLPPTDKHCDLSRLPAFAASAAPVLRQASL